MTPAMGSGAGPRDGDNHRSVTLMVMVAVTCHAKWHSSQARRDETD